MALAFQTPVGLLLHPNAAMATLAAPRRGSCADEGGSDTPRGHAPDAQRVFFQHVIWLAMLPPLAAFVGAVNFGWHLGAEEPLFVAAPALALASLGYFVALLLGFVGAAAASLWMAPTYGAAEDFGTHLELVAVVAAPLAAGSLAHLYPHVFVNLLVLIPALMWSMYLLYKGLPTALGTGPERGMLMASSLIGFLLVAAVVLLGATVALWAAGIGPTMGV